MLWIGSIWACAAGALSYSIVRIVWGDEELKKEIINDEVIRMSSIFFFSIALTLLVFINKWMET